jgi:DNA replication protein DnaC
MLALHAALANQFTRYNLILIGPFSVGAAWIMTSLAAGLLRARCYDARLYATSASPKA